MHFLIICFFYHSLFSNFLCYSFYFGYILIYNKNSLLLLKYLIFLAKRMSHFKKLMNEDNKEKRLLRYLFDVL